MNGAVSSYANPSGVQGVCPVGWHVPSYTEWDEITDYLGGKSVAGGKMKETGTEHWTSPNTGATNSSGFSALPGGYHSYGFNNVGYETHFWSSTESSSSNAWKWTLYCDYENIINGYQPKALGFSIRCVRD